MSKAGLWNGGTCWCWSAAGTVFDVPRIPCCWRSNRDRILARTKRNGFDGKNQRMEQNLAPIIVPAEYDYLGVYLTDACHLRCEYCITRHHGAQYGRNRLPMLEPRQWIAGLNRLDLPADVPITLQGGEPFLYKGIWEILENVRHKMDILTALP